MNIVKGESAKKVHLTRDAYTMCNIKLSGQAESMNGFSWWAEKHPETCCKKCLKRYNENVSRQKSK